MSSTVLQVSKDSQIQCLFSGAAAFIGEGIDFTHTHVGHWKTMSCEECQKNFRFERFIDSFSEQWFHCSPERCDIGEVLVKNLCWMIFTPIVSFASSHRSWLIHCYTAILQWDIASNYSVADVHWSTCSPWHQLFWRSHLWWFTSLEGNNIISFSLCWVTNRAENVSAQ